MEVSAPVSTPSSTPAASTSTSSPASSSSSSASETSSDPKTGSASVPSSESTAKPAPESAATEAKKAEEAVKAEVRKLKLKINGQERELSEDEVIRKAQLAASADERFQEAAKKEKYFQQVLQAMKERPFDVLKQLGVDLRQHSEQYLTEEVRREMMDPVERELEDLRAYKQRIEDERKQAEESQKTSAQKQAETEARQRWAQEYDRQITDVMQNSNLPKTAHAVRRVVELMHNAQKKGYDLDAQMAVDMVREEYQSALQALTGGLDGDHLLSLLGGDVAKKIRKYDLEKIRSKVKKDQPADIAEQALKPQSARRQSEPKYVKQDEWFERLRKKAGVLED